MDSGEPESEIFRTLFVVTTHFVASRILNEGCESDYWKDIQQGNTRELYVMRMTEKDKFVLQNPSNLMIHSAVQHPVYTDHYITGCGMVVTTSNTRHETNLTGFIMLKPSKNVTCSDCASS